MNFDRIGRKIKGLVKILFWIQVVIYGTLGIALAVTGGAIGVLIGIGIFAIGSFVAWLSLWFVYGYGELIDKVCDIAEFLDGSKGKSREDILKNLRSQGLISEEEFKENV